MREKPFNLRDRAASHPGTAERYVLMDEAIYEILGKQMNNEELIPNFVGKWARENEQPSVEN